MKLLRNRVRMLQVEHEKAQKKVADTAKKTEELVQLRIQNDLRYQQRNSGDEQKEQAHRHQQEMNYMNAQERRNQIKQAKLGMYMGKRAGVQSVRDKLREDLNRKREYEQAELEKKQKKREEIRHMNDKGRYAINQHQQAKIEASKADQRGRIEHEKRLIYKYEKEAQELENEEERLIQRL